MRAGKKYAILAGGGGIYSSRSYTLLIVRV